MTRPQVLGRLSPSERDDVVRLATAVEAADGVYPLNEQATLGLAETGLTHLVYRESGRLTGYAVLVPDSSAQLMVAPGARRRGVGTGLLDELRRLNPAAEVWSFADLAPAHSFAAAYGFHAVRELLVMELPLLARRRRIGANTPDADIRQFSPADLPELVRLNARAFHGHPEQGALSTRDFETRMTSSWFDPAGLLIAWNRQGAMVGFHWTKAEGPVGEVYVLGVDPSQAGHGWGRLLLEAGLDHLAARGAESVVLWVDGDNRPARTLYEASGFSVVRRDLRYRKVDT